MKTTILVFAIAFSMLVGCSDSPDTSSDSGSRSAKASIRGAEFSSLRNCMSALTREVGGKLVIVTDKPDQVSGIQPDNTHWACDKKVTGTKGTYWEGWYTVRK